MILGNMYKLKYYHLEYNTSGIISNFDDLNYVDHDRYYMKYESIEFNREMFEKHYKEVIINKNREKHLKEELERIENETKSLSDRKKEILGKLTK